MESRRTLTDEQWAQIEPLLPPVKGAMGRPQVPHRPVVEGIVFRYRAGIPWRDLPREFGPWQTVWKRHHRWSGDGTWDRVLAEVLACADAVGRIDWKLSADSTVVRAHQHGTNVRCDAAGASSYLGAHPDGDKGGRANHKNPSRVPAALRRAEPADHGLGRSRGGLSSKAHLLVDGHGWPLVIVVSPGQAGDSPAFQPMLKQLSVTRRGLGRPRTRPLLVRADKAYSSRGNRAYLRRRGIKAVIPEPSDQAGHRKRRGSRGGRLIRYDADEYRGRNVIERGYALLKQWRAIATRYDKHALTYRGALVVAAILIWTH